MAITRVLMPRTITITTTGGGLLNNSYVTLQDASLCVGWASMAALYDAYRVKSIRLRYIPAWLDSTYGAAGTPQNVSCCLFMDLDTAGATIAAYTYAVAQGYGTASIHETCKGFIKKYKLPAPAQSVLGKPSGWLDTSAAVPTVGAIAFVLSSTCNVASQQMGTFQVDYDVEFKNRTA